jgi:hypothetical protein
VIIPTSGIAVDSVSSLLRERTFSSDIVVGIVSGLVTGLMIYAFSVLWKRVLVPWYEDRVYKGLHVAGDWRVTHPHPEAADMQWGQAGVLRLRQTAHRLSGTLLLSPQPAYPGENRTMVFSGEIADRFIRGTMAHEDRSRLGFVVLLLEVVGDGRTLRGQQVHYDVVNHVIDSAPTECVRQGD